MTNASFAVRKLTTGTALLLSLLFLVISTGFKTGAVHERPFYGIAQTTATPTVQLPTSLQLHVTGTGTMTHLGKITLVSETLIDLERSFCS